MTRKQGPWADSDRFYVRFMRDGRYDGNVGPFPTEAAADFFLYASRNGGVPGRTALVLPILPLCPACLGSIGGARGGPDAPYRPAGPGESCGAADCVGLAARMDRYCPCGECGLDRSRWSPECRREAGAR